MLRARVGQAVPLTFTVLSSGTGVTGLLDGGFTKRVYLDGASDAVTVTVAELASGDYKATFTPDAPGLWHVVVRYTAGATEWSQAVLVGYDESAHLAVVATAGSTTMQCLAHMERDGERVTTPTSCTVEIFNAAGTSLGTATNGSPDANGVFSFNVALSAAIADNVPFLAEVAVTDANGTVTRQYPALSVANS